MARVRLLPRVACALVAATVTTLSIAGAGPAGADEQTTVDVLRIVDGAYVVETLTVPARTADAAVDDLEAATDVVAASPSVTYEVAGTPDPLWDADGPGQASDVRTAWNRTMGEGQVVAVLDTGVDATHPDLAGALVPGTNTATGTDIGTHGTAVAGVIAARADNGIGGAGMAPAAKVMPVRVCDGSCASGAVARGILWAADHGADVINMSLAGPGYSDVTAAAIRYALSKNISVIASSGNDGLAGNPVMYPAANSGVIAVGATTPAGVPAEWAVHGWQVDLATVGETVLAPQPGGGYADVSGTSFSGPAVAGAVALVRASHPGIAVEDVQAALQAGADGSNWDRAYGAGRLVVPAALDAADRVAAGLIATTTSQTLAVSWSAVPGATDYTVRVDGVVRAVVGGTSTTISGLVDGNQVAVDVEPSNGTRSRPLLATVAPSEPGTPVLSAATLGGTSDAATLTVTASVTGTSVDMFSLVRDGLVVGTYGATLTGTPRQLVLGIGAMPSVETRWQLQGVGQYGRVSPLSNAVTTGSGRPAAPPGITGLAGQVDGGDVLLTWDDLGAAYTYRVTVDGTVVADPVSAGAVTVAPLVGETRTYAVVAVDAWGQVGPATGIGVTGSAPATVPGAPVIGSPTAASGAATVPWTAPASDGGSAITGYIVRVYRDGGLVQTTSAPADAVAATVSRLLHGRPHTFTVTAVNAVGPGATSAQSSAVVPVAVPDAPVMAPPALGHTAIRIGWTAPANQGASPVTSYTVRVYRGGALIGKRTITDTRLLVTGLPNGIAHTFTVVANNGFGAGPVATVTGTPRTVPGPTRIGTATPRNAAAIVRWAPPVSDGGTAITGYSVRVYRGTSPVAVVSVPATATAAHVTGLGNGVAYTFAVYADNAAGTGAISARSNVVVPRNVPSAPRITAVAAGRSSASVSWARPYNGGSPVTAYVVRIYRGSNLLARRTVPATTTQFTVPGLMVGVGHTFTVTAVNAAGAGPVSATSATVVPLP